jgi:ADP-heptose:LPS heptosyltransferase
MKFWFFLKYRLYLTASKFPFVNREKLLGSAGKYLVKLNAGKPHDIRRKKTEDDAVFIACFESLGDVIACEPVARKMKEKYPAKPLYWVVSSQYGDVVRYNPYLNGAIEISSVAQWIEIKKTLSKSAIIADLHFKRRAYIMDAGKVYENDNSDAINAGNFFENGNSLVEIFSKVAGLEPVDAAPAFYLRSPDKRYKIDISGKYIAVHAVSAQWNKDWSGEKWRELIEKISAASPETKIVELGLFPSINAKSKNYVFKSGLKSVQDSADIIAGASAFIGVDSAMAHIANAFNVPGIVLMNCGYMPFSGNYQKQINSKILRSRSVKDISAGEVFSALQSLVEAYA